VLLGEDEVANNVLTVKTFADANQRKLSREEFLTLVRLDRERS